LQEVQQRPFRKSARHKATWRGINTIRPLAAKYPLL
jgi:hypothetical protein